MGVSTPKRTWAEIVALYRLTMERPPHKLQPRYHVCPTDRIDVVTEREGMRALVLNGAPSVHAGIFASVSTGSHNT